MQTTPRHSCSLDVNSIILRLNKLQLNNTNNTFPITEQEIENLCYSTRITMSGQPMLLELKPPVNICGDIHGQFSDLLTLIHMIGDPANQNYLFLGDYVDRGKRSLECFCLLMAYKIKHPNNFFLLRGNHECSQVNKIYGFYDQVKRKFNIKLWKNICDTFEYLPIAAVVGERIFCVHGGLSPQLKNVRDLNVFKRPLQPLRSTVVCDMLWSDPSPLLEGWNENIDRGVSFYFGANILNQFLLKYDFDLLCRSHQVVEQGYEFFNNRKLLTIFSAPNYCGDFENLGAVLKVDQNMKCRIEQFQSMVYSKIQKKIKRSLTPIPPKKIRTPIVSKLEASELKVRQQKQDNKQNEQKSTIEDSKSKNQRKITNVYMIKKQIDQKPSDSEVESFFQQKNQKDQTQEAHQLKSFNQLSDS